MPPKSLTLAQAPFKSSLLAIPSSPFSPKLPITPPPHPPVPTRPSIAALPETHRPAPPSEPLHWLWQCHKCSRVYQLGVTRRCLDDGHYFCSGTTTVRRKKGSGRKVLRHQACASEFDYQGWKAWGAWRRDVAQRVQDAAELEAFMNGDEDVPMPLSLPGRKVSALTTTGLEGKGSHVHKDCWGNCDYPSECRWGKQYGVETPVKAAEVKPTIPAPEPPQAEEEENTRPKISFDDILIGLGEDPNSPQNSPESPTPAAGDAPSLTQVKSEELKPSVDEVVESAKRRKRRSAGSTPSPLGSNPPAPSTNAEGEKPTTPKYTQKALDEFDGTVKKGFSGFNWKELKRSYSSGSL